ncbi:MAG: hypothetical protein SPJ83_09480 [Helicobacter sp.]|uniref:hypothetical protein n=1 Tax=Helicobacter sp. TaxID=218 RepID=UPI002A90F21E|nr:hypothetical protein [Helicobacter sp.]MDY5822996.1 hypothetical protein [Helicobacter sp.]
MKYSLIFVLLSMFLFGVTTKQCQNIDDMEKGCVLKEHVDGQLHETYLKHNELNMLKVYYKNGNLLAKVSVSIKDGMIDVDMHYKNGKLFLTTTVSSEGLMSYKAYDEFDNLRAEASEIMRIGFDDKDILDGVETLYYPNGDIFAKITYKNDKVVSGVCGNGKRLTNAHIHTMNRLEEILEAMFDDKGLNYMEEVNGWSDIDNTDYSMCRRSV